MLINSSEEVRTISILDYIVRTDTTAEDSKMAHKAHYRKMVKPHKKFVRRVLSAYARKHGFSTHFR